MDKSIATVQQSGNLVPLTEITQAAGIIAKSGLFGVKTMEQAAALMMVAQAEGLHYAQAVNDYDVIQGKPALKSSAILSRFQRSGGSIKWLTRTEGIAEVELSHPQGGTLRVKWDWERAKKAGFTEKDTWKKFPTQMLSARAVSEGVRALFPACLGGIYAVEEAQDFEAPYQPEIGNAPAQAKNVKPAQSAEEAQDAEILPAADTEAPETAQEARKPDFAVNINGGPQPAPKPAEAINSNELSNLREWIKDLPDRDKAMSIISKYCPPNRVSTLSKAQANKLVNELMAVFGVTYTPTIFAEA